MANFKVLSSRRACLGERQNRARNVSKMASIWSTYPVSSLLSESFSQVEQARGLCSAVCLCQFLDSTDKVLHVSQAGVLE